VANEREGLSMIDPLSLLLQQAHAATGGATMHKVPDPGSANAVMIVGIVIIVATTFWAMGGLSAAVWVRLSDLREERRSRRRKPR
jgi:hypothetical protein